MFAAINSFITGGIVKGQQEFTASGTFTAPSYVTSVCVVCIGAGGSGAGNGAGGGGGGLAYKNNITVVPGTSYTVTIGSGSSVFQGVTANDGSNGSTTGGAGGTATGGDANYSGGAGGSSQGSGGGRTNSTGGASGGGGSGGAVRIIWGYGRAFPSTLTNNL